MASVEAVEEASLSQAILLVELSPVWVPEAVAAKVVTLASVAVVWAAFDSFFPPMFSAANEANKTMPAMSSNMHTMFST